MSDKQTRCGVVAVLGAPNAGKSTLVNQLVGQKVAITSAKAQTTRTRMMGIALDGDTQMILVDTPGIFAPKRRLDRAMVSAAWEGAESADAVLLLSDVEGLFDRDPREPGARRIARVDGVSPEIMAMATADSGSGLGSGGMRAKLQAARIAERAGIALAIINGTRPAPFAAALAQDSGTVFVPQSGASARKAWLGGRLAPAGSVTVDQGCMAALDAERWLAEQGDSS